MWVVIEVSEAANWAPRFRTRVIPEIRRPTCMQPSREVAESEAKRLAALRPGCRFVVFEAVAAGITTTVPTHVNMHGDMLRSRSVATLVEIENPDDIQF